jgi:hypothetical protein
MRLPRQAFIGLLALIFALGVAQTSSSGGNPVEAGSVRWGRDFKAALEQSAGSGRPVFVLFQEIPGCSGCQAFGREVLTHPLLVEAIEEEFLPVLIYNNRAGADAELLKQFNEPAYNFQVVRFLDSNGRDLIPRQDRIWTLGGIAARMAKALAAARRPVPRYLQALVLENQSSSLAQCALAMPCFWTGEMELGQIAGVVHTEAGFLDGNEVVRVRYDPAQIQLQALVDEAKSAKCALTVYAPKPELKSLTGISTGLLDARYRKASESEQKKQLARWPALARLPNLSEMQKTKLNAFMGSDRPQALEWLSPRQRRALPEIQSAQTSSR